MPSKTLPLVLFFIVLFFLIGGIVYLYKFPHSALRYATPTNHTSLSPTITTRETSDEQLQQDMTSIDQNMTSIDDSLKNVDNALNDHQTNLQ